MQELDRLETATVEAMEQMDLTALRRELSQWVWLLPQKLGGKDFQTVREIRQRLGALAGNQRIAEIHRRDPEIYGRFEMLLEIARAADEVPTLERIVETVKGSEILRWLLTRICSREGSAEGRDVPGFDERKEEMLAALVDLRRMGLALAVGTDDPLMRATELGRMVSARVVQ